MADDRSRPDIQLICNVVVHDGGDVLLTRYDDAERWWLPGSDLEPYEHPDAACARILRGLEVHGLAPRLHHVESFRGRRGWHVMFNYDATLAGERSPATGDGRWFGAQALPRTAHGDWERGVIARVLA